MACKILKRLVAIAAVASAIVLRPAHAQNVPQPPTSAPTSAPTGLTNTVPALLGVLNSLEASQGDRDEAARRLLVMGTPEAIDAMQKVLVNTGNAKGQAAVARAMADGPPPDPIYVDPLRALIGTDNNATEAAARALANLRGDPRARIQLLDAARDEGHRMREALRALVIHSLAPLGNKQAAELLVSIVSNDAESATIRAAAADELAEMSGDATRGRDGQLWKDWWAANGTKSDEQFEREMLEIRARRLDRIEPKVDRLVSEMRATYRERFQEAPTPAAKESILLAYLRSPEAEIRALGVYIVRNLFIDNKPIPQSAQQYLRRLVGDADEQVRLDVAAALREVNDRGAVDDVVAQLNVERVPVVRAALAKALVPMGDVRAVPPLLALLKEQNPEVVLAAAQALESLHERVQQKDPKLAAEITQALDAALQRTAAPAPAPAASPAVREAIVAAMVAWATPQSGKTLYPTFVDLVKPNQPENMRRLALQYFGQMGPSETWPAENIVRSGALDDPQASIRLAAVEALALTAKAQNAQQLYEKLDPANEKDEQVRAAAWNGLAALFPREIDAGQLSAWADKFQRDNQPDRWLAVLEVLQKKMIESKAKEDDLAVVRQNIGTAHALLKEYGPAATAFRLALDTPGQQNQRKEFLIQQLLEAYLLGKEYSKAASFGAEMIGQDQRNQSRVGPAILDEVRRLASVAAAPDDALRLIEFALKMDPPLADNYARQLRELEPQLRAKVQQAAPPVAP